MTHKVLSFLYVLVTLAIHACAYVPNSAGADVWAAVEPYLLPEDHPIKPILDSIFNSTDVTLSISNLKKAGFRNTTPGKYSKTIVATHPRIKNYLIKMYVDRQVGIEDWSHWKHRVQGANAIREAIEAHGYQNIFTVPHKWIYPLPSQHAPPPGTQRKQFVLVVEDMDILSSKDNLAKWKSRSLSKHRLDALYILLTELGLWDSVYAFNIPFTKSGKIAFIDTEFHHGWPVHISRLKQYLSKNNRLYLQTLINHGGPAQ